MLATHLQRDKKHAQDETKILQQRRLNSEDESDEYDEDEDEDPNLINIEDIPMHLDWSERNPPAIQDQGTVCSAIKQEKIEDIDFRAISAIHVWLLQRLHNWR